MKENWNKWLPIVLMVVFAVTRWPGLMPPNFSAAYGLAFCAGVFFPRRLAWWLPMSTLLMTDILANVFYYDTAPLSRYMLINYACFAGIIFLGQKFSAKASWLSLLGGGLLGSILFYLVTNTFAWLQNPVYPKTLGGWIQALTVGVPGWPQTWELFRNTLLSGGLFTGLFAGAMKLSEAADTSEEDEESEAAEDETAPEESQA